MSMCVERISDKMTCLRFRGIMILALLAGMAAGPAMAGQINLLLKTDTPTVYVGETVLVDLVFKSTTSPGTGWTSADVMLQWNDALEWQDFTNATSLAFSKDLPADPESPTARWWTGGARIGQVLTASYSPGMHVTTFSFKAIEESSSASIFILSGDNATDTMVLNGMTDVTGGRSSLALTIIAPEPSAVILVSLGLVILGRRAKG